MTDAPTTAEETDLLARFVADRDVACPVCGYNVRGAVSAVCAECGAGLRLRVAPRHLRIGPWLAAFCATALPLGFFGSLLVVYLWMLAFGGGMSSTAALVWCAVGAVGEGALFWLVLSRRRGIAVKRGRSAWRWAVAITVVSAAFCFPVFFAMILQ